MLRTVRKTYRASFTFPFAEFIHKTPLLYYEFNVDSPSIYSYFRFPSVFNILICMFAWI